MIVEGPLHPWCTRHTVLACPQADAAVRERAWRTRYTSSIMRLAILIFRRLTTGYAARVRGRPSEPCRARGYARRTPPIQRSHLEASGSTRRASGLEGRRPNYRACSARGALDRGYGPRPRVCTSWRNQALAQAAVEALTTQTPTQAHSVDADSIRHACGDQVVGGSEADGVASVWCRSEVSNIAVVDAGDVPREGHVRHPRRYQRHRLCVSALASFVGFKVGVSVV